MQVTTYNQKGEAAGKIELPKDLFEVKLNSDLVYQVAVTQMANRRQSNANAKGRGEVSGGGKKPWRQKGTGRARQGSIRAPQWRHGGVVFGPTNEKIYGGKINKKMRRKALAMVLSAKVANNSLIILESLEIAQPKTKEMTQILESLKKINQNFVNGKILIALPGYEKNTVLASRNISGVETAEAVKMNVLDLLNSKCLLMPASAIATIVRNPGKESAETKKISVKTASPVKKAAKIKK
jgi:large subunit ribosomal protein L4